MIDREFLQGLLQHLKSDMEDKVKVAVDCIELELRKDDVAENLVSFSNGSAGIVVGHVWRPDGQGQRFLYEQRLLLMDKNGFVCRVEFEEPAKTYKAVQRLDTTANDISQLIGDGRDLREIKKRLREKT